MNEVTLRTALSAAHEVRSFAHRVPRIVGSAYGAAACDQAIRMDTALAMLAVEIECALMDVTGRYEPHVTPSPHDATFARDDLRARAAAEPLPDGYQRKRRLHPLTWREHELFGTDLKDTQYLLAKVQGDCRCVESVHWAAGSALRSLLWLRAYLEAAARREHPDPVRNSDVALLRPDHAICGAVGTTSWSMIERAHGSAAEPCAGPQTRTERYLRGVGLGSRGAKSPC